MHGLDLAHSAFQFKGLQPLPLLSFTVRDEESVIRTCGKEEDTKDRDCYTTVLEEYNTEVCSCKEDLCNSATSVSAASVAASVLTAALAHLFGKF